MPNSFVPERLVLARERRGLTKTELAKRIGKTAPTVSAYERADREPPTDDVVKALALALGFPTSFFYADPPRMIPQDAASFRALTRMSAGQRNAALAIGALCVELEQWIGALFELPAVQLPDLESGLIEPEAAALYVRSTWGLGSSPLENVLQTLEGFGVRVFSLALDCREVDAFSFWCEETETPFIVVGTHKTPERQVFDLAHELGHLILHRDDAAPRGRAEEREADAFASSFLMPRDDIIVAAPRSPSFNDLVWAKHRWKVSVAALAYRLNHLGLMSDWSYHNTCVQLAREGKNREVQPLPREQSQVLGKVLQQLRSDGVGLAAIASDLHLHVEDLRALVQNLVPLSIEGDALNPPPRSLNSPRLKLVGG